MGYELCHQRHILRCEPLATMWPQPQLGHIDSLLWSGDQLPVSTLLTILFQPCCTLEEAENQESQSNFPQVPKSGLSESKAIFSPKYFWISAVLQDSPQGAYPPLHQSRAPQTLSESPANEDPSPFPGSSWLLLLSHILEPGWASSFTFGCFLTTPYGF
jgi:hypothetical protein